MSALAFTTTCIHCAGALRLVNQAQPAPAESVAVLDG